MKLLDSKKGQFHNYMAVILFFFTFGFLSILAMVIFTGFITAFSTSGYYDAQAQMAGAAFMTTFQMIDFIMVIFIPVFIIGIGVTSYRLFAPPVFFILTLVQGAFYGFVAYFFSYLFGQMMGNSAFTAALLYYPRTVMIGTNLHWVALGILIVGSITLYAKRPRGEFVG